MDGHRGTQRLGTAIQQVVQQSHCQQSPHFCPVKAQITPPAGGDEHPFYLVFPTEQSAQQGHADEQVQQTAQHLGIGAVLRQHQLRSLSGGQIGRSPGIRRGLVQLEQTVQSAQQQPQCTDDQRVSVGCKGALHKQFLNFFGTISAGRNASAR